MPLHGDMGHHGGGGGLAVGAGEADGVLIGGHDIAPGLGPLKYRDPGLDRGGDLRVFVVDSGGADDAVRSLNVLGTVADGHGNAGLDQMIGGLALVHIRAGDRDAHAVEHHAQGAHGYAADADEMDVLAGLEVFSHFLCGVMKQCWFLLVQGLMGPIWSF